MVVTDILAALGFVAAAAAAAAPGALLRPGAWYRALARPPWCPPDWLFAPVWAVLYLAIAFAGWLVWRSGDAGAGAALLVYAVHLVLNAAWSWIFFGKRRIGLACVEIGLLWLGIVATIALFHPIVATAAWLLVPYLAWVSFAAALNLSIWRRNRGAAPA